jgi:hypothetical protein
MEHAREKVFRHFGEVQSTQTALRMEIGVTREKNRHLAELKKKVILAA